MITYNTIIIGCWVAFILVWGIAAFWVKKDVTKSGIFSPRLWLLRVAAVVLVIELIFRLTTKNHLGNTPQNVPIIFRSMFTIPLALGWIAAVLCVIGILFAIWARFNLGRNWSSQPSVKENHELVTSGPYKYVRHPIYTGIILAAFGAALTGSVIGFGMLIVLCIIFFRRVDKEEKIMLKLFPTTYPPYQSRTKRLIPFVW